MGTNTINSNSVLANGSAAANGSALANGLALANGSEVTSQANAAYVTHLPVLKKGKAGQAVRFLQQFLNCYMGYYLVIDGQFGSQTEQVVMKFQSDYNETLYESDPNHLIVDGIVSKKTYRAIDDILTLRSC
ncbi:MULTISPECIES: peptidoglycan-binding domain-containing protein [Moorena]|uniref:Peptidoglycan binding domain protein n=1 Tax=Moorena producens 3L TaxID=489825 RepID=F4Y0G6_9CYAN|nr:MULTISPECIES: peptidoglycan-binding domain-containing protein [Moorena]NEO49431.1 peptidoglycan-binding protein [Moorena sp. SIO4A3]EGJ29590.1 peptidoglycan binding domain protein [Moorena producens 3L]NEP34837.1 peptidoglycan-binding protein [Moorena sp. SIO3B2]NEP66166.1 peptidoglycan-binding protein [Moorena sp. SIO3A5]NEQ08489.1 peptidoglycan-binding protein [Moorena sp. SIO4E2]